MATRGGEAPCPVGRSPCRDPPPPGDPPAAGLRSEPEALCGAEGGRRREREQGDGEEEDERDREVAEEGALVERQAGDERRTRMPGPEQVRALHARSLHPRS
jgi:hypothetical protein